MNGCANCKGTRVDPRSGTKCQGCSTDADIESQALKDAFAEHFKAADYHWSGLQDFPPDRFRWSQFSRNERVLLITMALNAILIAINVATMWLT